MSKSIADVLSEAADLIAPPGKWTHGTYARDAAGRSATDGEDQTPIPPTAACFCLYGAVAYSEGVSVANSRASDFLALEFGNTSTDWNDEPERTQEEVVAKLREAADLAREQGL